MEEHSRLVEEMADEKEYDPDDVNLERIAKEHPTIEAIKSAIELNDALGELE